MKKKQEKYVMKTIIEMLDMEIYTLKQIRKIWIYLLGICVLLAFCLLIIGSTFFKVI